MNQTLEPELVAPGAIESITRGEVDISIATARKYPRQPALVKQTLMGLATLDEETALGCFYTVPRGGKSIQGPSVRLAELALSAYGNLSVGCRIISVVSSGENPHVIIQAVAHDLQCNSRVSLEKRRSITGKKSKGGIPDSDDVNLAVNACTAIAFRDCVLKAVPQVFIKPAYEAAKKVAVGDQRTLSDRRAKSIEAFAKMGVDSKRVLASLEKKSVDEIGLEELEILIGVYNAIKDGETKIDEAFPPIVATPKSTAPTPPAPTPATTTTQPAPDPAAASTPISETHYADLARQAAANLNITEAQVIRYLQGLKPAVARGTQTLLVQLADSKLRDQVIPMFDKPEVVEEIRKIAV